MAAREYWIYDGISLSEDYCGVRFRSSGFDIPSKDGVNVKNPNSDGAYWQAHKPFVQKTIPLQMWVTGYGPKSHSSSQTLLRERIDKFTRLFGRSGMYRLERRHYMDGAVNRVINPSLNEESKTIVPTGITTLASGSYTASANGYIGYELPAGTSTTLTINNVVYNYENIARPIAGWVYMSAGQVASGTLPTGGKAYFYNPATANHTQVSTMYPLPRATYQWEKVNWAGGSIIALSEDGRGKLVMSTPSLGKYTYGLQNAPITPEEQIMDYWVEGTLAPIYLAEATNYFPKDIVLNSMPTSLFEDVVFYSNDKSSILVPTNNIKLVPTTRGYVIPADGISIEYDTSGWTYTGSTEWGHTLYGSGVVKHSGGRLKVSVHPLSTGTTIHHKDSWFDAYFGEMGQTVRVSIKSEDVHIVSKVVVSAIGIYTSTQKMNFPPEFFDGDYYNARWTGAPHASESVMYSSRWIDAEPPIDGVTFNTMAGGTRAEFDATLTAPKVYWRDNEVVTQTKTFTASPAEYGSIVEWDISNFRGSTAPIGDLVMEITATSASSGYDVELEIEDSASGKSTVLTMPINQTWKLDATNYLFYKILPVVAIDKFASFANVSKNYGGDLIYMSPTSSGAPLLKIRSLGNALHTINYTIKVTGKRRYLSA